MKSLIFIIILYSLISSKSVYAERCSGGKNCRACKTCNYCGNCAKRGGTCSTCVSENEYSFGGWKWILWGIVGLFMIVQLGGKSRKKNR